MEFELTNKQRKYFGIDPVEENWDMVPVKPGFPTEGYLYFNGDVIKRHVVSVDFRYSECHYNEQTRDRTILLPKTSKGKEKKLSGPVLGQRQPRGVYLEVSNHGVILIGNHTTQTTFYSSRWDRSELQEEKSIAETVTDFISESTPEHLSQIEEFRTSKRQRVRFRSGDYFSFKLSRTEFGFGRVLLDINKVRKAGLLPKNHGLNLLMGPPVLIQLFAITSNNPYKEISKT